MESAIKDTAAIEKYLAGQMDEAESNAFEAKLEANPELKEQVTLQREIMEGLERVALKQSAQRAYRQYKMGKKGLNWGLGGLGVLIVAGILGFVIASISPSADPIEYVNSERNIEVEADADQYVPSQVFQIESDKDTVITTTGGISLQVMAHTFVDEEGEPITGAVELEVKEALDPLTIMEGGLSTMSGAQALETGGMFYLTGDGINFCQIYLTWMFSIIIK